MEEAGQAVSRVEYVELPPGYRFDPEDHELIKCFLEKKVMNEPVPYQDIPEIELANHNPEDLLDEHNPEKYMYYYTQRDRKYPNGHRPNRAADRGYWKTTGSDKPIEFEGLVIGLKNTLVFHEGKPQNGVRTKWLIHEFRLNEPNAVPGPGNNMRLDWVLFRIFEKKSKLDKENMDLDMEPENNTKTEIRILHADDLLVPPGYRFSPFKHELINSYLVKKVKDETVPYPQISEIDVSKYTPEDIAENKEYTKRNPLYFYSPRERKFSKGARPNRGAVNGYWKAAGKDKEIRYRGKVIGYDRSLNFYHGKYLKGVKTDWIMHEYKTAEPEAKQVRSDGRMDTVLCCIYKNTNNYSNAKSSGNMDSNNSDTLGSEDYPSFETAQSTLMQPAMISFETAQSTLMQPAMIEETNGEFCPFGPSTSLYPYPGSPSTDHTAVQPITSMPPLNQETNPWEFCQSTSTGPSTSTGLRSGFECYNYQSYCGDDQVIRHGDNVETNPTTMTMAAMNEETNGDMIFPEGEDFDFDIDIDFLKDIDWDSIVIDDEQLDI